MADVSVIVSVTIAVLPKTVTDLMARRTPDVTAGQPLCTPTQTSFEIFRRAPGASRDQESENRLAKYALSNCTAAARALAFAPAGNGVDRAAGCVVGVTVPPAVGD